MCSQFAPSHKLHWCQVRVAVSEGNEGSLLSGDVESIDEFTRKIWSPHIIENGIPADLDHTSRNSRLYLVLDDQEGIEETNTTVTPDSGKWHVSTHFYLWIACVKLQIRVYDDSMLIQLMTLWTLSLVLFLFYLKTTLGYWTLYPFWTGDNSSDWAQLSSILPEDRENKPVCETLFLNNKMDEVHEVNNCTNIPWFACARFGHFRIYIIFLLRKFFNLGFVTPHLHGSSLTPHLALIQFRKISTNDWIILRN